MAADPQNGLLLVGADAVGGVALVLARVIVNVQVIDEQLRVVVPAVDEETASRVVEFPEGAVVELAPGPDWMRISHRFTVENSALALVSVLTAFVARDLRSRFDFDGGVGRRRVLKSEDTHVDTGVIRSRLAQSVLGVFVGAARLGDLLPVLHPVALDVCTVGAGQVALQGERRAVTVHGQDDVLRGGDRWLVLGRNILQH